MILRVLLGHRNALKEWRNLERGVASALVEMECLRTLDRIRLSDEIADEEIALRRETVFKLLDSVEIIEITMAILTRAAQPFLTSLGTLDAIHLATALLWQESREIPLLMATHDGVLATASRASGLQVVS